MTTSRTEGAMDASGKRLAEELYERLSQMDFTEDGYHITDLGEGMTVIEAIIGGWWKQIYLMDKTHGRAYRIMDSWKTFLHFSTDDIDWDTLKPINAQVQEVARKLSARFPTFVNRFHQGVAEVSWQLNPDGYYYMDEDGFGMTSDREITVYGFIDTEMNVLVKFQYINKDWERLKAMRHEAEQKLKEREGKSD